MNRDYIEESIHKLDVMIGTFGLALGDLSAKEREAMEHLKDAQLAMVESLEAAKPTMYQCAHCGQWHPISTKEFYCPLDPGRPTV